MIVIARVVLMLIMATMCCPTQAASFFHSYITDLSPPYICRLKLKAAKGVGIEDRHLYQFSGICSVKVPIGNTWIYQNVWVDTLADWNGKTNEAFETTTLYNNLGTVAVQLKCDDDPWLTKAQCSLVGYQNNTQFTNFAGVYNSRTGQYPPFETITGQYPPLARNQAILREAIILSVLAARQEAAAAHAQFLQTFASTPTGVASIPTVNVAKAAAPAPSRPKTHTFICPKIDKLRLDWCVSLNHDCGKPAADRFCQSKGFREAINCKVDPNRVIPTMLIGTLTVCNQPYCRGFEMIECAR